MTRTSMSLTERPFKNPYFFRAIRQIRVLKKQSLRFKGREWFVIDLTPGHDPGKQVM
jgi:hypothetical protein